MSKSVNNVLSDDVDIFAWPSNVNETNVKETNRTRSLSRDKNFEKNTKTPFFPPNRKTCVFFVRD